MISTGTKANEVSQIQERYIKVLRTFLEMTVPSQPNRLTELLRCLPEVNRIRIFENKNPNVTFDVNYLTMLNLNPFRYKQRRPFSSRAKCSTFLFYSTQLFYKDKGRGLEFKLAFRKLSKRFATNQLVRYTNKP